MLTFELSLEGQLITLAGVGCGMGRPPLHGPQLIDSFTGGDSVCSPLDSSYLSPTPLSTCVLGLACVHTDSDVLRVTDSFPL